MLTLLSSPFSIFIRHLNSFIFTSQMFRKTRTGFESLLLLKLNNLQQPSSCPRPYSPQITQLCNWNVLIACSSKNSPVSCGTLPTLGDNLRSFNPSKMFASCDCYHMIWMQNIAQGKAHSLVAFFFFKGHKNCNSMQSFQLHGTEERTSDKYLLISHSSH